MTRWKDPRQLSAITATSRAEDTTVLYCSEMISRSLVARAAHILRGSAACSEQLVVLADFSAAPTPASGPVSSSHRHYSANIGLDAKRQASVNRLLYRAKQRGFLEMDLLVGMWAEKNVPKMDAAQLKAMEEVLDQENPDLFKWLTGQESASEDMMANPAFKDMQEHVAKQLNEHRDNAAMSQPGKEWVRGWDDWNSSQGSNAMRAPERKA
ncbi:g12347 [Coccomyxa viridis]|uniref:G12347 protein n=1 Tax=Coccomyxa viridis TaxID=1274662 RepID=A0ABP1GES1_9CHLO